MRSPEQRLIDIMFEVAFMVREMKTFQKMEREELADWIRTQLRSCGFDTEPVGASWGVLKEILPELSDKEMIKKAFG